MLTFWYYFAVFPRRISVAEREPHAGRARLLAKAFGVVERRRAFTLLEMLIVMGIMATLMVLVAPAFTNLKSAGDVTNAVYGIQGLLDNARTYAKANNTYVFVGFAEVDSSVDSSVSPQITTGASPYGRVAIAVVASKDGTRHFQFATSNQGADWQANYADSGKPEYLGAHLASV